MRWSHRAQGRLDPPRRRAVRPDEGIPRPNAAIHHRPTIPRVVPEQVRVPLIPEPVVARPPSPVRRWSRRGWPCRRTRLHRPVQGHHDQPDPRVERGRQVGLVPHTSATWSARARPPRSRPAGRAVGPSGRGWADRSRRHVRLDDRTSQVETDAGAPDGRVARRTGVGGGVAVTRCRPGSGEGRADRDRRPRPRPR